MRKSLNLKINMNTPKDDKERGFPQIVKFPNLYDEEQKQLESVRTAKHEDQGQYNTEAPRKEKITTMPMVSYKNAFERIYEELEYLGEGGAATVKKCRHKQSGQVYACKIMRNWNVEKQRVCKEEF